MQINGKKIEPFADLTRADLSRANLSGEDLTGAIFTGAIFTGADLSRADLFGANLSRADLGDQWIIQGPTRSDGYQFLLVRFREIETPMVRAGCRCLSLPDAKKHWETTRGGTQLGHESLDILIWLEHAMNLRRLK